MVPQRAIGKLLTEEVLVDDGQPCYFQHGAGLFLDLSASNPQSMASIASPNRPTGYARFGYV